VYGAPAYLCAGCTQDLAEHLTALPTLFGQLEEFLLPAARTGGRGARPVEAPAPLNLDVVDLRTEIAATLTSWHVALYDALDWDPQAPASSLAERVKDAAEALHVNRLWIASSWPAAGDCAGEIRELYRSATSVVGPREQGTRLGYCPTVADNGAICGSVLRLPPGGRVVKCRWCQRTYPPGTWAALRLAQEDAKVSPSASPAESEGRLSHA
jgi:LSD1 subclass zinc finger protein